MKKKIIAIILAVCVIAAGAFVAVKFINEYQIQKEKEKIGVLARGTIDGNVYTNTFADFTFTKPDSWSYSNDEGIAEFIGYDATKLNLNEIETALSENPVIYDMIVAGDAFYANSMLVSYENTLLSVERKINEDEYIEILKENFSQSSGVTYKITETKNVNLGHTTFKRATLKLEAEGVNMTQYFYIKAIDQYVVGIMVNITSENNIEDIEAMFS